MNPSQNESELQPERNDTAETEKQETIFQDLTDFSGYDKNLKTARIYLYIIVGIQLIAGIYQYFQLYDAYGTEAALLNSGILVGIGLVFLVLAIWSYKKPAAAFLTALIFFIVVHTADAIADPAQLFKGILLKIFVIIALIKGLKDAREYEETRRSLGAEANVEFR